MNILEIQPDLNELDKRQEAAFFLPKPNFADQLVDISDYFRNAWQPYMEQPYALVYKNISDNLHGIPENLPRYGMIFDTSGHEQGEYVWQLSGYNDGKVTVWEIATGNQSAVGRVYKMDSEGRVANFETTKDEDLIKYMWGVMHDKLTSPEARTQQVTMLGRIALAKQKLDKFKDDGIATVMIKRYQDDGSSTQSSVDYLATGERHKDYLENLERATISGFTSQSLRRFVVNVPEGSITSVSELVI